jgi:arylsulfatase A-like enzyme
VGGYEEWGIKGKEITSQPPLHGGKGMLYEGGIREPTAIRWPGVVEPGSACGTPITGVDFYPTMLEIAGAHPTSGKVLDGESIVPLLTGSGELERDAVFWHFPAYLQGRENTWRTTPAGAMRQGDYKLLEFFEDGRLELYNLKDDIGERHDLSDEMPQRTRQMHERLVEWRRSVRAPVPTEANPEYDPEDTKETAGPDDS